MATYRKYDSHWIFYETSEGVFRIRWYDNANKHVGDSKGFLTREAASAYAAKTKAEYLLNNIKDTKDKVDAGIRDTRKTMAEGLRRGRFLPDLNAERSRARLAPKSFDQIWNDGISKWVENG